MRPSIEHPNLVGGPDRHAGAKAADHVVDVLAAEQKHVRFLVSREKPVELETVPLVAADIQAQFHGTVEQENQCGIADENEADPAPIKGL